MSLPSEHLTPRIAALKAIVDNTTPEGFLDFPGLRQEDYQLIGLYIQQYNYIDLNLRRCIEVFAYAGILCGDAKKNYPLIHSSGVALAVQNAVETMDLTTEDIPEAIRILKTIEYRRTIRNLLGHWAARRIPNEDAIVLLTKNEKDAKQTSGSFLGYDHVRTAIYDLADLRGVMMGELIPFETWLAKKTSDWRKKLIGS